MRESLSARLAGSVEAARTAHSELLATLAGHPELHPWQDQREWEMEKFEALMSSEGLSLIAQDVLDRSEAIHNRLSCGTWEIEDSRLVVFPQHAGSKGATLRIPLALPDFELTGTLEFIREASNCGFVIEWNGGSWRANDPDLTNQVHIRPQGGSVSFGTYWDGSKDFPLRRGPMAFCLRVRANKAILFLDNGTTLASNNVNPTGSYLFLRAGILEPDTEGYMGDLRLRYLPPEKDMDAPPTFAPLHEPTDPDKRPARHAYSQ
jgi:hypothetical protein